jgi:hypothetical protein
LNPAATGTVGQGVAVKEIPRKPAGRRWPFNNPLTRRERRRRGCTSWTAAQRSQCDILHELLAAAGSARSRHGCFRRPSRWPSPSHRCNVCCHPFPDDSEGRCKCSLRNGPEHLRRSMRRFGISDPSRCHFMMEMIAPSPASYPTSLPFYPSMPNMPFGLSTHDV